MARASAMASLVLAVATIALFAVAGAAQEGGSGVIADPDEFAEPASTAAGTPTPSSEATAVPLDTATPPPDGTVTPEPTPASRREYITPGWGNAAQQGNEDKADEQDAACDAPRRPPTSHMLGVPGVIGHDGSGGNVALLLIAAAVGAALFAFAAYRLRRQRKVSAPTALEGVATLVAICVGLAGLAAQFIPSASVEKAPERDAQMVVRDVKPGITRAEYLRRIGSSVKNINRFDRVEIGNVVWLELTLTGFKDQALRIEYGSYDLDAREALLPGTSRPVELEPPRHDVETAFVPIWVGYPRSAHFKAEFRLIPEGEGVQQLAATGPMKGAKFRYACEQRG